MQQAPQHPAAETAAVIQKKKKRVREGSAAKQPSKAARSSGGALQGGVNLPDHLMCPITCELMVDPVFTADGQTYERSAIEAWFNARNRTSPATNKVLKNLDLIPNVSLRGIILDYLECK